MQVAAYVGAEFFGYMKMDRKSKKTKVHKDSQTEQYLKIPYHILNIENLNLLEKVLLAHFYSFGKKGCWQSNATLAKIFMTSPSTISRWISKIKEYIYIKCPKGYYRTIWAKSHPEVRESVRLFYRDREISKSALDNRSINEQDHTRKCVSDCSKSAIRLKQKCATTNNTTIKDTTVKTIAPPALLPAGGQAPAALQQRSEAAKRKIDRFGKRFGKAGRSKKLSAEDEQKRRLYLNKQLAVMEK
jgi:hypothetical protein